MKKRMTLSFIIILSLLFAAITSNAATFEDGVGKEEIPYGKFVEGNELYGYKSFNIMTESEAKAAGVPDGYSGYVLMLEGNKSGGSIALDFSKYRIRDIEKITFRVWCPAGTKSNGVRLSHESDNAWIMLANPGVTEQWVNVTLDEDSNFYTSEKSFDVFDSGSGYGKTVNFSIRYSGSSGPIYIDSITFDLKAPDTVSPIITYDGESVINTTAYKPFSLSVSAYDEYDAAYITPEYIFSDGAIDKNGFLLEGNHTCTVRFTDFVGNYSELKLTLNVAPKDTVAPILSWTSEKIFANVGMKPVLDITAEDDCDGNVGVTLDWSKGALDTQGKLVEGKHILTVSATDKTGNTVKQVIPVFVTDTLPFN